MPAQTAGVVLAMPHASPFKYWRPLDASVHPGSAEPRRRVPAGTGLGLSGVVAAAARSISNERRGSIQSLVSGSNATSRLVARRRTRQHQAAMASQVAPIRCAFGVAAKTTVSVGDATLYRLPGGLGGPEGHHLRGRRGHVQPCDRRTAGLPRWAVVCQRGACGHRERQLRPHQVQRQGTGRPTPSVAIALRPRGSSSRRFQSRPNW